MQLLSKPRAGHASRALLLAVLGALLLSVTACGGVGPGEASWPPMAKKWFDRADASYHRVDIDDAQQAVDNALRIDPHRTKIRLLAAHIALARLQYDRAIQLLQGLNSGEARGIRGRALWYSGKLDAAADELEALLSDPDVRDPWAQQVAKLARLGTGRKPFSMSGGLVAVTEMPQVASTSLVVPLEVNGEPGLGLIATGTAEAFLDSSGGNGEPSWVSLRFGSKSSIEVKDVPALPKDLSGISRQLNAPIKMLIGVNLLRHLHCTFDFAGSQFVVRTFEPPPPPHATTVKLAYVRGGGMVMRGGFGQGESPELGSLLVDTSMTFPVALDKAGWKKAGVALSTLQPVPDAGGLRHGVLPLLRVGAFQVPSVPAVYGAPVKELEDGLGVHLDGLVGSGLLAAFRVTLVDDGRTMWLEDNPAALGARRRPPPQQGGQLQLTPPSGAPPPGEALPGEEKPAAPELQAPSLSPPPAGKAPQPHHGNPGPSSSRR
jgi:hypothetical protein